MEIASDFVENLNLNHSLENCMEPVSLHSDQVIYNTRMTILETAKPKNALKNVTKCMFAVYVASDIITATFQIDFFLTITV